MLMERVERARTSVLAHLDRLNIAAQEHAAGGLLIWLMASDAYDLFREAMAERGVALPTTYHGHSIRIVERTIGVGLHRLDKLGS